jgi:malate dehydrogenase
MRKKVSIVGAGNVGATAAHWIASKELADVVLIDVVEGIPQGKALDLLEAMPIEKRDVSVIGANDYAATANSDIVVITAGIPRKPGMSRDDLLHTNFKIMSDVVARKSSPSRLSPSSSSCRIPLDAMAQAAYPPGGLQPRARHRHGRRSGFRALPHVYRRRAERERRKRHRVCARRPRRHHGSAGALFHCGRNSDHRTDRTGSRLESLIQRTRDGGAEIVKHLKTGSAYYAPSAAATEMVEAILKDKKKILPCAAYLQGRVRHRWLLHRRSVQAGRRGPGKDHRDQAHRRRRRSPEEERRAAVKELCAVIGV